MNSSVTFIYDGKCPFCNKFAELLELKSNLTNIQIKNGRDDLIELNRLYRMGYDLNKGAILIDDTKIMQGAEAINQICSQIDNPSDSLLEFLRIIFKSYNRTVIIFPFLLWARRILLSINGVKWKPVNGNIKFN